MFPLILLSIFSFLVSAISLRYWIRWGHHRFSDIPNERSSHQVPTPRNGGLGILCGFWSALLLAEIFQVSTAALDFQTLCLLSLPLITVGIIEDLRPLAAWLRYGVQIYFALVAVYIFGPFGLQWLETLTPWGKPLAFLLTVIGITAGINFYNFMDGLDGIVGGTTFIQLLFFSFLLAQPQLIFLAAAILGFLCWNWPLPRAKIFMGDAGSTFLGALISLALLQEQNGQWGWSCMTLILPIIADAIYTVIRRLVKREAVWKAHRSHIYQRLHQSGWSHGKVSSVYVGLSLVFGVSLLAGGEIGAIFNLFCTGLTLLFAEIYLKYQTLKIQSKEH